jgi:hypothetical protein
MVHPAGIYRVWLDNGDDLLMRHGMSSDTARSESLEVFERNANCTNVQAGLHVHGLGFMPINDRKASTMGSFTCVTCVFTVQTLHFSILDGSATCWPSHA